MSNPSVISMRCATVLLKDDAGKEFEGRVVRITILSGDQSLHFDADPDAAVMMAEGLLRRARECTETVEPVDPG